MKVRQIRFRKFRDAQLVASGIRSVAGFDTYSVDDGNIPSPAGQWADAGYVLTDAPMSIVRKAAKMHNVEIPETGKTIRGNPDVFVKPQQGVLSESSTLGMIRHLAGHLVENIDKRKDRENWDDADAILSLASALLRQLEQGTHTNPSPLVTYMAPNPPGRLMSHDVQLLAYRHIEDGSFYVHTFGGKDSDIVKVRGRQVIYLDELPSKTGVDMRSNRRIVTLSRPDGAPLSDDF